MSPEEDTQADNGTGSPARQGDIEMVSYANMDSAQVQAARAAAQEVAQTTPSELTAFDIGLLYESDIHKATKRIMDAIKERGGDATKQESTVLDRFGVALQWMKASEQNEDLAHTDFAALAEAKTRAEAAMAAAVRAVRGEDDSDEEK